MVSWKSQLIERCYSWYCYLKWRNFEKFSFWITFTLLDVRNWTMYIVQFIWILLYIASFNLKFPNLYISDDDGINIAYNYKHYFLDFSLRTNHHTIRNILSWIVKICIFGMLIYIWLYEISHINHLTSK